MMSAPLDLTGGLPAIHYSEPQPSWLPLHLARWRFFPHFAADENEFATEMKQLIEDLRPPNRALSVYSEGPIVCIETDGLRLSIDSQYGTFDMSPMDGDDLVTDQPWNPSGLPENFFAGLAESRFVAQFAIGGRVLETLAERLWRGLQRRFSRAVNGGSARLFGRWYTLDADFKRVHFDQLDKMEVTCQEADAPFGDDIVASSIAVRSDTEEPILYSLHVEFANSAERTKGNPREKDATDALVCEMRAAPLKPRSKSAIVDEYALKFKISKTSVRDRVWPDALERVPECCWRRPGRRKTPGRCPFD